MTFLLRVFLLLAVIGSAAALAVEPAQDGWPVRPRARVIVDNDFGGDPDGLFALAHQLLSPSVEVRAIVGSHHYPAGFYGSPGTAGHAVAEAEALLAAMGGRSRVPVLAGAETTLTDTTTPVLSAAARFIVQEAMREDVKTPLYVVCGAGLTDVASAWLMEPRIGTRLRLVWIGGLEHAGLALPPPGAAAVEYNLGIDRRAAQVVFNRSDLTVWQVPRDAYRQALVSHAELRRRIETGGPLGQFLLNRLGQLLDRAKGALGETYVLGDNPLVLLTSLQSAWEVDPASSLYVVLPTPQIDDAGAYRAGPGGRPMRVYTQLDVRLMLEDLYAKIAEFDRAARER